MIDKLVEPHKVLPHLEASLRSNANRLLLRNASHLGIGQVVSTALGILLAAVIGRAFEPAQLGILYLANGISSFAYVIVDWGQNQYLVREIARGRIDEPELIGSAFAIRVATVVFSSAAAVAIALVLGYSGQVILLTLLAMAAGIPAALFGAFDCAFRGKDRMDIAVFAMIVGKATMLVATAIVLRIWGGLSEVILMQGVGALSTMLVWVIAAQRSGITVKAPGMKAFGELFRHGTPIAAFALVIASQPFLEIVLLSAFVGPVAVGWYGAFRNIFGTVASPALILLGAAFPELSRASLSLPDLRRTINATERILCIAAAIASSALYLFADHLVAILYGHGRFEQTASILRVSAIFVPLLFFTYLLASVIFILGRSKALVVVSVVRIFFCAALGWLLIGYWQQRFGNGAIALVIIGGVAEILATIAYLALLPRGAVGSTTTLNWTRAYITSLCTVVPLSMLPPLGLFYLTLLYAPWFAVVALVTRLISPSDLRLVLQIARKRVFVPQATKSAPDG